MGPGSDRRVPDEVEVASGHTDLRCDVLIVGAGVAGLSAGILLARAGLRVVCVEPEAFPPERVGESLDWSAPALLAGIGMSKEEVVVTLLGTYRQELRGVSVDGQRLVGRPPAWVARWPLRFEPTTVHVDRPAFDAALYERALAAGVEFVWDRIETVVLVDDRVTECLTRSGVRLLGRWVLDASGRARLIARSASIERARYGVPRIALWTHQEASMDEEATTLYFDDASDQLTWIWEIPIASGRRSLGVVMPLELFRLRRSKGSDKSTILLDQLRKYDRFGRIEVESLGPVTSRAFHPYVHERTTGRTG